MISTSAAERIVDRIQTLTRAADQKASALGIVQTGVPALLAESLKEWFLSPVLAPYKPFVAAATVGWIVSLVLTTMVLMARTQNRGRKSLTFFGDISSLSIEDYRSQLDSVDDAALAHDFADQAWVCAGICNRKYFLLKWTIRVLAWSWGLMLLCYFVRGMWG